MAHTSVYTLEHCPSLYAALWPVLVTRWMPQGWTPPTVETGSKANAMITTRNVHIDTALRTPQFWMLWTALCCNVTAGIGVIGVAKTMIDDIFVTTLPHLVTASFAAVYVQMISVFNMGGRFLWASASDYLGRKNTFHTFFGLGIPLCVRVVMLCGEAPLPWGTARAPDAVVLCQPRPGT